MRIAILTRPETMERCTGKGCLRAFQQRLDAFSGYGPEAELTAFTHAGGDLDHKIARLREYGVTTVHLSSCLRSGSPDYEALAERLSAHFNVVGYTHGAPEGKTRPTCTLVKASAGSLTALVLSNVSASARYFKLFNKATAPAHGTDTPLVTIPIPANSVVVVPLSNMGLRFATGIGYAITVNQALLDNTSIGAGEVQVVGSYF